MELDQGLAPTGPVLSTLLDALRLDRRTKVDMADLKRVVSQLGSQIAALEKIPAGQREHAEAALCRLIHGRGERSEPKPADGASTADHVAPQYLW